MEHVKKEECQSCKYFRLGGDWGDDPQCHYNSPDAHYGFPFVRLNCWCGKFESLGDKEGG